MKNITILDCYTDEPSGLGVPPYIGTYPRYLAGRIFEETGKIPIYLTIDDIRNSYSTKKRSRQKTDIKTYNLTSNGNIKKILAETDELIVIIGVHVPGKYLSAVPGTLKETESLIGNLSCIKTVTGPAVFGTQIIGGKRPEKIPEIFDRTIEMDFSFQDINRFAILGAKIIKQIPDMRIAEIETGRGCDRVNGCSFCTEPIKHCSEFRKNQDILSEIKSLSKEGIKHFRLGKQSCFYSHPEPIKLLREIRKVQPTGILHIDNVNPEKVITKRGVEITKAIADLCSDGNVAAFGVESFDKKVIKKNNLNSDPDTVIKAVEILNKYGSKTGSRGQHAFLPGINILFGLIGETKATFEENMKYLSILVKKKLLVRRINIRKVIPFNGTVLGDTTGSKFLRKNGKYYWKWREKIRHEIDLPMLELLVPKGTVIREVRTEIHDGNTTFGRPIGTYPLIMGIRERLPLHKYFDVEVTDHMLRSVVGKIKQEYLNSHIEHMDIRI